MRKRGHTGWSVRILSYMMTVLMVFLQPCGVLAAEMGGSAADGGLPAADMDLQPEEEAPETDSVVKYIVAFEALAEEETYYPCMYKPTLEELLGVFPEMLLVWLEDEDIPVELAVTWKCEEDYEGSSQSSYFFYPKWDETLYALSETWESSIEVPVITVEVPQEGGSLRNPEEAKSSLQEIIQAKAVLASIYLCDTYEIKAGASSDSETVQTAVSGQSVQITGVESDEYGIVWYQVLMYRNGTAYTGYVEKNYLATSDEEFIKWEETYLDLAAVPMTMDLSEGYSDIEQFPASYQNALYALKEKHPDWTFVRMNTGLDWNTAIASEMEDRSWISSNRSGSWQNGSTAQKGWSYASEGILKYYMDPRNFLAEPYIFQFELLVYNSSYHTADAVQGMLNDSFMAAAIPDDGRTYAQAFTTIGQEIGVSPFHLAARVLQEQGPKGTSALISGAHPNYQGYYNFFNVGASGKTIEEVIANGLKRAVKEGWNSRYASLRGGAYIIGNQYILCEQDTLYLEKFNVASGKYANYTHQYMQNIEAPYAESSKIYRAYSKAGVLERRFVFKIPVYENMPASACAQPEKTDALTLDKTVVSGLEVDKSVTLVPYVNGSKVDYVSDMIFTSSNTAVAVVDAQGKVTAVSPGDATISCSRSGVSSANCTVTVVKGRPVVATPVLSPVTYREGLKLSDVALPAGWTWADGSVSVEVGTPAYAAVYTPTDTTKYHTLTKNISFTVTKAIPVCQVPTGLEVKSGAKLGSIALPGGFAWESDTETLLTNVGEYTFYVFYNPDENNYYTVNHIPIIVQVKETVTEQPSGGGGSTPGSGTGGGGSTPGSGAGGGGSTPGSGTGGGGNTPGSGTGGGENTSGSGTTGGDSFENGGSGTGSTTGGSGGMSGGGSASGNGTSGGNASSGGSASAGNTQPPAPEGSTSAGSTTTAPPQMPSGGISGTGAEAGNSSSGNALSENRPENNDSSGGTSSGGQTENQTSGSESSGGTPGGNGMSGNTQPNTAGTITPDSVTQQTGTTTESAGSSNPAETGGNTQTNVPDENGGTQMNDVGNDRSGGWETESSADGGAEESELGNGADYYRPAVTIHMEDTTILTPEKMQMAREQNFDLLLDMGGAVTWSIDVESIDENAMTEVDMGVTLGTETVPKELISTILNGNKYLEVTLAHQGPFGFEAVLNIAIGKEYSGQYANLFYYDPEKGTLEFICDAVIGPDGVASLQFDHASCYLIIVSEQSMSGVSLNDDSVNPLIRWIIIGVLVCMFLVVIGYGFFFFLKKRKEEDEEDDDGDGEDDEEEDGDIEFVELDDGGEDDTGYAEPDDGEEEDDIEYEGPDDGEEEDDIEYEGPDDGDEDDIGYEEPDDEDNDDADCGEFYGEEDDSEYEEPDEDDDWIEDEDWQEPEPDKKFSANARAIADARKKSDWPEEEGGNAEDDWIEDDEWTE